MPFAALAAGVASVLAVTAPVASPRPTAVRRPSASAADMETAPMRCAARGGVGARRKALAERAKVKSMMASFVGDSGELGCRNSEVVLRGVKAPVGI